MIIYIFLFIIFYSAPSFASEDWVNLGIYGGQINSIAVNPENSNTLYLGAYYGDGLYKSTDSGQKWNSISEFRNHTIDCIKLNPENPNYVWTTLWNDFSLSKDGGENWLFWDLDGDRHFTSLGINSVYNNIIYVGATGVGQELYNEGIIYRCTIDNDDTIFYKPLDYTFVGNIYDIEVDPKNPSKIWAVTYTPIEDSGEFYYTEDGGENWKAFTVGDKGFFDLEINSRNTDIIIMSGVYGIYRTTDGGKYVRNWKRVHDGFGNWCRALKIHPKNPLIVYAGTGSYLLISSDGGENFSEIQTPIEEILALDVDPNNPNIIYAGALRSGVYKSIDWGVTWTKINNGVKSNHVYDSNALYSNEKFIIAGATGGIYTKTSDKDWNNYGTNYFLAVKIDKNYPSILYGGTDYDLWISPDYGNNWSQTEVVSSYDTSYYINSIAINPVSSNNLYVGLRYYSGKKGEIYTSYNYGGNFIHLFSANAPVNSIEISYSYDKTKIFAGTGNFYAPTLPGYLYQSENSGSTWEKTTLPSMVVNTIFVDPKNPQFILVGGGDSTKSNYNILYKSEDNGVTWVEGLKNLEKPMSAVTDIKQDEKSPNIFYFSTFKDGIYVSYDGMETGKLIGLSDYNLYDLSTAYENMTQSSNQVSILNQISPITVYSGTNSGIYQYTAVGIGQITGLVIDSSTGKEIAGAQVSAGGVGQAKTLPDGFYLIGLPSGIYSVTAQKIGYNKGTINNIVVASGGVTYCPAIYLTSNPCPAEVLLKEETKKLNNLRAFKDTLKISQKGIEYVNIYYKNANKILRLLNNSPSLRDEAKELLNKFIIEELPNFTSLDNFHFSSELKPKLKEFIKKIEKRADKDLKEDINKFKKDFCL
jgi:photosystem II stability/assembly factor-like uncharacterized protein